MKYKIGIRFLGMLLCLVMALGCCMVVSYAEPLSGTCGEKLLLSSYYPTLSYYILLFCDT